MMDGLAADLRFNSCLGLFFLAGGTHDHMMCITWYDMSCTDHVSEVMNLGCQHLCQHYESLQLDIDTSHFMSSL